MASSGFRWVVQTPHGSVFDRVVRSVRLPTASGHVGLRPRCEPNLLVAEAGLILVRGEELVFMASVGGLVRCDRDAGRLLTPVAVVGSDRDDVRSSLDRALALPGVDLELRRVLIRLETGILHSLRDGRAEPPSGATV